MADVKIKHSSIKGGTVSTRCGDITLDGEGIAHVAHDVAEQLIALYGRSFQLLDKLTKEIAEEVEDHTKAKKVSKKEKAAEPVESEPKAKKSVFAKALEKKKAKKQKD